MHSENKDTDDLNGLESLHPAAFQPERRFLSFGGGAELGGAQAERDQVADFNEEGWRSLEVSSLDQQATRAVDAGAAGGEFVQGGSDSVPNFSLDPKHSHGAYNPTSMQGAMSAQKSKLALSQVMVPRVEPPTPPGGYLEASSHFYSGASPASLIQTLLLLLGQFLVDCKAKHEQFRIKCDAYRSSARLSFWVTIFSASEKASGRYIVEFQRRTGDALYFGELFRAAKRGLAEQNMVEGVVGSSIPEPTSAQLPMLECEVTFQHVRQTVKSLLQMVQSNCVDIKTQGIIVLADLTAAAREVQSMMVEAGVLEVLIEHLSSTQTDVHRSAITGIANLAKDDGALGESVCKRLHARGVVKKLCVMANSEVPQVVREVARLLSLVGSALGTKVMDDREFSSTLKGLAGCRDPRARDYAATCLDYASH